MLSLSCIVLWGILHNCIRLTNQCSPPDGWIPQDPSERAKKAEIVIYGTVTRAPREQGKFYNATFRVYCVVKGKSLPKFVNVSGFGSVAGHCTSSRAQVNRTYIAFLKRNAGVSFSVHEVNVQEATVRVKHKTNQALAREIVKSIAKNTSLPFEARNSSKRGCPELMEPFQYSTNTPRPTRDHCKHNHMIRRLREHAHRCKRRKAKRLKSTRVSSATTLEATFESGTLSSTPRATATKRWRSEEPDFEAHGEASHIRSTPWCFVLTFHSLVSLVVKLHQT